MKNLKLISLVLVTVIVGCKQNPLPKDGQLFNEKPAEKKQVLPPLLLEMPESVEFFEGKPGEIDLKATVPAPGTPVVSIEGLPDDAKYDEATGKISWTPDFGAANDERDPRSAEKAYPLRVYLRSSEDSLTYIQRPLVILVRDMPRNFRIEYPKAATAATTTPPVRITPPIGAVPVFNPNNPNPPVLEALEEGQTLEREITVNSEDFPKGPFDLRAQGLPEGATISTVPGNPSKFIFSYQPSALTVDLNSVTIANNPSVTSEVQFIATDPAGRIARSFVNYTVTDKRLDPQVTVPSVIELQGGAISFTIRADDLNGEVPPKIIPKKPAFGKLERKSDQLVSRTATSNPWASSFVRWVEIPEDKFGGTSELEFSICVQKARNTYEYCKDTKVTVNLFERPQPAPLVDRKLFPVGTVKYVKQNEKTSVMIPVRGQERPTASVPTVLVTPADQGIKWDRNTLAIEPTTTGMKQVILMAKSPYGGVTSEGFLVEVLPWSWSNKLILGESPVAAEVVAIQAMLDDSSVANSALQLTEPRTLALRDVLIIGTTGLNPKEVVDGVEEATTKVKDVMILSPLIDTLKGALSKELKDLKVDVKSRVRNLADYTLEVTGTTLQKSADPIKLLGTLTDLSKEPTPIDISQAAAGVCEPLLKLVKTGGGEELVLAAKCTRKNQGKLIVSGVEWADIEVGAQDRGLLKKWMTNLGLVKP